MTLVQTQPGLNGALRDGAAYARTRWPGDGVAALVGDLPAVRPDELAAALDAAAAHPAAFVPDSPGTGTTLLTARPGHVLEPRFGEGSAARHAAVAARLTAGPGLRHDVDTADDLRRRRAGRPRPTHPGGAGSRRGPSPFRLRRHDVRHGSADRSRRLRARG